MLQQTARGSFCGFSKGRTGSRSFTNKSYELFFNFLEGIQIVHKEHMSLAWFAGNVHQLPVVSISEANGKDDVAYGETRNYFYCSI